MRILKAKAKNFLSYEDFEFEYTAQGLTLIEGHDEDLDVNTGAGKSAFLDVISYGLFGLTSKKLKADEVINWNTKKNLEVELIIEDEGVEYTIVRYRKHKDHENDFYLLRSDQPGQQIRGKDARETQSILEGILHFNHALFTKAVYFGQFDAVDKFLRATDKEKKELIGTICDLSAYDDLLDGVKADIKGNKEALEDVTTKLTPLRAKKQVLIDQLSKADDQIINWNTQNDIEIQDLVQKMNSWESQEAHRESEHQAKVKAWDNEKEAKMTQLGEIIGSFDGLKQEQLEKAKERKDQWDQDHLAKLASLDEKIANFESDRKKQVELAEQKYQTFEDDMKSQVEEAKQDADKLNKAVQDAKAKWLELKNSDNREAMRAELKGLEEQLKAYTSIEQEMGNLIREKAIIESENAKLRQQILDEKAKVESGQGDCPHCHQPVSSEHLQKHIEDLTSQGLANSEKVKALEEQLSSSQESLAQKDALVLSIQKGQDALKDADKIDWELRNLESEGRTLSKNYQDKIKYVQSLGNYTNPYEGQVDQIRGQKCGAIYEKEQLQTAINPFLAKIEQIEAQTCKEIGMLEELEKTTNPHGEYQKGTNPWPAQIEAAQNKVNPFLTQKTQVEADLEESCKNMVNLEEQEKHLQKRLDLGNFWKEALGVYIRSFLMDAFLEQLNEQANVYLDTLFSGVLKVQLDAVTEGKKTVKEKISQRIYNGNQECSYEHLSGGERCRVCLAINLALSDITAKTLGKSFSILMLDEIFTGLDSAGKSQTMRLLKELEPRFETIFVIDHTEEFKSLFTNNIMVTKKGGISSITKESV